MPRARWWGGPAFYGETADAGAQITVRFPLMFVRARYLAGTGGELWFGYEVPIPFLFQRSR